MSERVGMTLKIDGDGSGAQGAVAKVNTGLAALAAAAARAAGVLANTGARGNQALGDLAEGADKAAARMTAMSGRLMAGLTSVAGIMGSVAKAGLEMNEAVESATRGLTHITGSSATATKMVADLQEAARTSAFEFKQLLPIAQQLAGAYGPQGIGQVLPTIQAFSDAAVVLGADIGSVERALLQYRQLLGSERGPQKEELDPIRDNLPGLDVSGYLKQAFGTADTETLQKMGVTGKEAARALLEGMKGEFSGAGREAAGSLETMSSGLRDELNRLAGAVTTGLGGDVKAAMTDFSVALSGLVQDKESVAALKKPFDEAGQAIRAVGGAVAECIQWFRSLPAEQKNAAVEAVTGAVKFAAFATAALAASGAVTKLVGTVANLITKLGSLKTFGPIAAAGAAGLWIGSQLNEMWTGPDEAEARAAEEAQQLQAKTFAPGTKAAEQRRSIERALADRKFWLDSNSNHDALWHKRHSAYLTAKRQLDETGTVSWHAPVPAAQPAKKGPENGNPELLRKKQAAERAAAKEHALEMERLRVQTMPEGPARDRAQKGVELEDDLQELRERLNKKAIDESKFNQLATKRKQIYAAELRAIDKKAHDEEVKRIQERTKIVLAQQELQQRAKIAAMPDNTPELREKKRLEEAMFEHKLRIRGAKAEYQGQPVPESVMNDLRTRYRNEKAGIEKDAADEIRREKETESASLLNKALHGLDEQDNQRRRAARFGGLDLEKEEAAMRAARPEALEKVMQRLQSRLTPEDIERLLQLTYEAQVRLEEFQQGEKEKAETKRRSDFDTEQRSLQLDLKRAQDEKNVPEQKRLLTELAERAKAEGDRRGATTNEGIQQFEAQLDFLQQRQKLDKEAAATAAEVAETEAKIARTQREIARMKAAQANDGPGEIDAIQKEIDALNEQKAKLADDPKSKLEVQNIEKQILALVGQQAQIRERMERKEKDARAAAVREVERIVEMAERADEAEEELARRKREREFGNSDAGRRAYMEGERKRLQDQITAAKEKLGKLGSDPKEAEAYEKLRQQIAEMEMKLLDWDEKLEKVRRRWKRFWQELGDSMVDSLKSSTENALTGLFEGLMGAKGRLNSLLTDLLSDVRSIVARALSSIVMEGTEDLIRSGIRSIFGQRKADAKTTEYRGGERAAADTENPEPRSHSALKSAVKSADGMAGKSGDSGGKGGSNFGKLAAVAGLAAGGLFAFVSAIQKGKDGFGSAVPMLIAALVQLVLAIMVAKSQIMAGPAGMIAGAVMGLASLFGGKHADGGRPAVGKLNLVGERGPELFVPDSAGTIVPNHELGRLRLGFPQNLGMNLPHPAGRTRLDQPLRLGPVQTTHHQERTHNDHRAVTVTNVFNGPVGDLGEARRHEREEYEAAWKALATG